MVRRQKDRQIRLKLSQCVQLRNGVPLGAAGSLINMIHRSLGAGSFAGYWPQRKPIQGRTGGHARYRRSQSCLM